jgi:hypothetical protein
VPFAQPETSEQGLEDLFRKKPYKPSSPEPHANTSASPAPASAAQEDHKMPSLPTKTKIDSLETAQAAVEAYQASWQRAIPEAREAMQEHGQKILQDVEALKKAAKQSYRHQVLVFETQDVDPLVWERVLQEQEAARASLNATRDLRTQLLDTYQGDELKKGGIRTPPSNDQEAELYSSDEDEQQLSSEAMRDRQESLKDAIDVTKEVVEAILESGPTLGAGAAVKVAGKLPKVLKATKVGGVAVQRVAKVGKGVASYKFPGKKELAKRLNVTVERFHRETKKDIMERFSGVLQKKGIKNPDIGTDSLGNIVLKDTRTGKTILTEVPLSNFIE